MAVPMLRVAGIHAAASLPAMPLEGEYEPSPSKWAADQAQLYESTGGDQGGLIMGKPCVVLTSKGRRTGKLRKTPLMRVEHDGTYAVVASLGGAPKHPVWYYNLIANPHVTLQDGPNVLDLQSRELTGDEKATWWARAVEVWPDYDTYQAKTDRIIPMFVLEPIAA
jgi:deazaflavin-dependent oxidoreductase (nitroreductase family)